ncbi:hypothetical protein AMS68_005465 [Peltaster fructicola]|uniref:Chloride channel protein n=1 Tax=Peltaster fructicola TaxID=286661 RepID=A0A6H0XZC7_9PEZI|nr:hypothetical protein AMS68_005465 [Peltaster fructicola]
MPDSTAAHTEASSDEELHSQVLLAESNSRLNSVRLNNSQSPLGSRSRVSLPSWLRPTQQTHDERTSLLRNDSQQSDYYATLSTPTHHEWSRHLNYSQSLRSRAASRRSSFSRKLPTLNASILHSGSQTPLRSSFPDTRAWYDQFTSTDWIRDAIADAVRVKELRARRDWRGRLQALFDGAQGWILVAIIGCLTAGVAYVIDVTEATIFDLKSGFCSTGWWHSKRRCCGGASTCDDWSRWSSLVGVDDRDGMSWLNFAAFCLWVVTLAMLACLVTLATKTSISSNVTLPILDENLDADHYRKDGDKQYITITKPLKTYYPAAGSGVAEVKTICSGFVLRGYLGVRTLACKSIGLILSVASGLSIGKEGPYVHIATCIGNITSRMFKKYNYNDGKRREVLSAASASGVAVAFGAPIGGVLFSLEEVSYYFPSKTLFRTFFCSIVAALSLKFLNPYGTGKIVLFEVRYLTDWHPLEIIIFCFLGVAGGILGAGFIKASRLWAKTFRRIGFIKHSPLTEVFLVALTTGLVSFWNRYTRLPVAELLFELATTCDTFSDSGMSLCATQERIPQVIKYLLWAFVVKALLTVISFGIKVPAGIYVPSMVVGACWAGSSGMHCRVYALVAAGATMTGVTRLSVCLAIILFELTGSLEHVLPFSLGVLIAKWTADALEPSSIYDLLMDAYPYLDSSHRPSFDAELADIVTAPSTSDCIDITDSPWISAIDLRQKLQYLHLAGERFLPAPDLEFALDSIEREGDAKCYVNPHSDRPDQSQEPWQDDDESAATSPQQAFDSDHVDLTSYIDPAPVALDICSPMDLVFEMFTRLGLRAGIISSSLFLVVPAF